MQGGHADGVSRRLSGVCAKERRASRPIDTMEIVDDILITPAFDAALNRVRELFALVLATPVAWIHLDASVAASKVRKLARVKAGAEAVVALQARCRWPFLDTYFQCWSFCAEEEFYLLTLPVAFWNVDYRFARQMNFVVCGGLLWGNLLKDVFRLPRPANVNKAVWVPTSATHMDSTACRDFGFPSTHAMNAVSNSLFTVLYVQQHHAALAGPWVLWGCLGVWVFSLALGRLYLGVHSPMDVKGGLGLGLAIALIMQRPCGFAETFDGILLHTPNVGAVLLAFLLALLVLNPQPRPMTPTFLQNTTLAGLIFGCAIGFRMDSDRRAGRGLLGIGDAAPPSPPSDGFFFPGTGLETARKSPAGVFLAIARTMAGFVLILLVRAVLKGTLVAGFRGLLGLDPSPKSRRKVDAKKEKALPLIRGWDLFAAAAVKFTVYTALAWMITCGCPHFFDAVLKMPCTTFPESEK